MLRFISNNDGTCYVDFDWGLRVDTPREVVIPKYSPSGDLVTEISQYAFCNCTPLKSITIPDSVLSIGHWAFQNCTKLNSISLPDSVKSIGDGAFYGCTNLKRVTIGDSIERISWNAFDECIKLKFFLYEDVKYLGNNNNPYIALISSYDPDILFCTIHPQTKIIADSAFKGCRHLMDVIIPNTVKSIGDGAFEKCISLKSITIPDGVKRIGCDAFYKCTSLENIVIPDSVKNIDCDAFTGCTSLVKKVAIKATNADMTCRGFQYEVGKWYHEDKAVLCKSGFHYVTNVFDIFAYYSGEICKEVRFFKVKAKGESYTVIDDSKRVCKDICLYEEITSYKELLN